MRLFEFKADGELLGPKYEEPLWFEKLTNVVEEEHWSGLPYPKVEAGALNWAVPECDRRRMSAAAAPTDADGWLEQWEERVGCWWVGLPAPTQTQLGACMGALAIHLGSRLDAAWRAAQSAIGRGATTAAQQQPAAEPNCEWISRSDALELPEFPQLPRELDFALPPIPRLLPSWEQLQQLQSRGVRPAGTLEASRAHRDEPHASTASSALVATAGVAGFLVAFGVGVAFAWRVRRWQLPSLAIRKRQRPLGKEFGSERTSTL